MGKTAAERQRARREKLKAEGKKQLLVTLEPEAIQALNEQCEKIGADYSTIINRLLVAETSVLESDIYSNKKKRNEGKAKSLPKPKPETPEYHSWAMDFVEMAISQLERINRNDPRRVEAFNQVIMWVDKQLND